MYRGVINVFVLVMMVSWASASDTTYVVINTNGSGVGSLNQAIQDANGHSGTDSIYFNIPGPGPHTIQPSSALWPISEAVVIDGYTQPGASPATAGSPATLKIEIDGTNAGTSTAGLEITGGGATVRGLVINRFTNEGIYVHIAGGNVIEGNHIGTNVAGSSALGNGQAGIYISGVAGNTIGGITSAARNVVSGNSGVGILLSSAGATANVIEGNYIGTDATGTADLGNGAPGIEIDDGPGNTIGGTVPGAGNLISGNDSNGVWFIGGAGGHIVQGNFIGTDITGTTALANSGSGVAIYFVSGNTVGGTVPGAGNLISGNAQAGVSVDDGSTSNLILSNAIFSNGGLGIDLDPTGVTANDAGDPDTGANNLQNFPVVTQATVSAGHTTIKGSLNSIANGTFWIEFFSNSSADPSGHGEGGMFLGATVVNTNASGNATFLATLPTPVTGGHCVSATATNLTTNDTSEFSGVLYVTVLTAELAGIYVELSWTAVPGAAQYYLHGASNDPYFQPDGSNILEVIPPSTTMWSASAAPGYPPEDWTYQILALDPGINEITRTNRAGEFDFPLQ